MAKRTNTTTSNPAASDKASEAVIATMIFASLLHGAFKQPERFEVYAKNCAKFAKVAAKIAIDEGLDVPALGSFKA